MICTCIYGKTYSEILDILSSEEVEMAEILLHSCPLSDEEIEDLFANSETPLVATCRPGDGMGQEQAAQRLALAIEAGARFADLELEAPAAVSRNIQKLCRKSGTELIRSYHNFEQTPGDEVLQMALARCFRYGADIAKIAVMCHSAEDIARIESLYSLIVEGVDSLQGRLIAFGMGPEGTESRLDCLRRGAPFTYAALGEADPAAPGQPSTAALRRRLYGDFRPWYAASLRMPASKSFAQRAIISAALATGTSRLGGYTPCSDSEAAIKAAEAIGATVTRDGSTLVVKGAGPSIATLPDHMDAGESGLLARLLIPLLAARGCGSSVVTGSGTLPDRPLLEAGAIMASFGVLLSSENRQEIHVPVTIKGKLIPGNADVSGAGGSQLISGLLMALPLCGKDSQLYVSEPKSIPYMYITLDVLRRFGISTRSEMEGDAEMLENQDWSACSGIAFRVRGNQSYKAADFEIEADWSAAANFLVAGAIFGSAEIEGLDTASLQADLSIIDILVEAGAVVSQSEDGAVGVRKAPLEPLETDLSNAPDLFPIVSVLAAFCAGESRILGVGRLSGKESDRAGAILEMLTRMGVEASIEGDALVVEGESLTARLLGGRLLEGGNYSSRRDHRMAMALKVASLGAKSPIVIDDEACVGKSFPEFFQLFD